MIRVLLKLAAVFVIVTVGVHFGYRELEERLLSDACKPLRGKTTERRQERGDAKPSAAASETAPPAAGQDFQIIVRRNIFQPAAGGKLPEEAAAPTPAPTSLNLALTGTITSLEQSGSWAVITDNAKRKQQVVRVGGKIEGTGAVVKTIAWNRVTLEVNGRTEVLDMLKPNPDKPGSRVSREANRIEPPEPEPVAEEPTAEEQPVPPPPALRPHRRINLPPVPEEGGETVEEAPPPPEIDEGPALPEPEQAPPVELPPAD